MRELICKNCKNSYQSDNGVEDLSVKEIVCVICGNYTLKEKHKMK